MNIDPISSMSPQWQSPTRTEPPTPVRPAPVTPVAPVLKSPTRISYRVDDSTDRVIVSIIDPETGQTLRQIPSEEMLTFFRRMNEAMQHMLNSQI